ncbi:MAG: SH3 domain-containing protein [Candidatus Aminicenantales bacterium]
MKKPIPLILIGLFLILILTLLAAETLLVKVQSTSLRSSPKFYASSVQALQAGDKVEKISAQDGWIQVKTAGGTVGWVHSSAVLVPKFDLMASKQGLQTQASSGEIALAGKGFNKQVEESYRAKNKDLSFVWVDKMLQVKISASQVEAFLKKGRLGEHGGAR